MAGSGPDGGIVLTNAGFPWLSYAELSKHRPDLIHLQITGRPDGGAAVDYTVNAAIGFPLATGPAELRDPVNHVLPAWDVACGLYAAVGLLAAERHRRRTGQGRAITLPLADVALAVTGHLGFLAEAWLHRRQPSAHRQPSVRRFREGFQNVRWRLRHGRDPHRAALRGPGPGHRAHRDVRQAGRAARRGLRRRRRPLPAPGGDRRAAHAVVRQAHSGRGRGGLRRHVGAVGALPHVRRAGRGPCPAGQSRRPADQPAGRSARCPRRGSRSPSRESATSPPRRNSAPTRLPCSANCGENDRMRRLTDTDGLTEFQRDILRTVRDFVDAEVLPVASELDHADAYPDGIVHAAEGTRRLRPDDRRAVRRARRVPAHLRPRRGGTRHGAGCRCPGSSTRTSSSLT